MKFLGVIILHIFFVLESFALNDARDLEFAKKNHMEIFTPGNVSILKIDGVNSYVFTGSSFRIDSHESNYELYDEAELVAKQNFYKYLTKGMDENVSVQMSQTLRLHQFNEKNKLFVVILYTPFDNVNIVKKEVVQDNTQVVQTDAESIIKQEHFATEETTASITSMPEVIVAPTIPPSQQKKQPLEEKSVIKEVNEKQSSADDCSAKIESSPPQIVDTEVENNHPHSAIEKSKASFIVKPLEKPQIGTSYKVRPLEKHSTLPSEVE